VRGIPAVSRAADLLGTAGLLASGDEEDHRTARPKRELRLQAMRKLRTLRELRENAA